MKINKNLSFDIYTKGMDISEDGDNLYIEGYASVETMDRSREIVLTSSAVDAIEKAMKIYQTNPVVLYEHKPDRPCGKMVEYRVDDKGLFIKVLLSNAEDCTNIKTKIREGILKGFSIGFGKADMIWDEDSEVIIIKSLELFEISIVSVPCNRDTLFNVATKHFKIEKRNNIMDKKVIELTTQEYQDLAKAKALYEITAERAKNLEESVAGYKEEIAEATKNGLLNSESVKALETQLAESKKSLEEMNTKMAELEAKSNVTLSGGKADSTKKTVATGFDETLAKFKSLNGKNIKDLEAAFIADKVKSGKDVFEYSNAQVLAFHLGMDLNPENIKNISQIATKAITSSNGVIQSAQTDYMPIEMDDIRTPLLAMTPMAPQSSKSYKYYKRTAKNTASFAAEGFTPTVTSSTYSSVTDDLKVMYSAGQVSDFAEAVDGSPSNVSLELKGMDAAMNAELHWTEIHGNESADAYAFDGLMKNTSNSSGQVIDNGGSVLTLDHLDDIIADFKSLMAKSSTAQKKPTAIGADTALFSKIRKLLRAATTGIVQTSVLTIGGVRYENVLVYDGVPIIEMDDLRDWSQDAPTFSVAKGAGGDLAADEYFVNVSGVTANGETTAGTEASATTETTNLTINVTITQDAAVKYYKIFWGEATGVLKLIKIVENDGEATQVVAIATEPTATYETNLGANEGILLAMKLGNEDGFEFGVNELKRFVRLGKTGDFEKFYIRSYIRGVLKNPYAVIKMQVKKAT